MRSEKQNTPRPSLAFGLRAAGAGLLLVLSMVGAAISQEDRESGRIVLDIPIRQSGALEDSREQVTIVVRGMLKSRSGAT